MSRQLVYRPKEAADLIGVHLSTLYRWAKDDLFPAKVRLGPRRVGFVADDVHAWIAGRSERVISG